MPHAIERIDLAGRDLSEYFIKLLTELGVNFNSSSEREIAKNMKETLCYIAIDPK